MHTLDAWERSLQSQKHMYFIQVALGLSRTSRVLDLDDPQAYGTMTQLALGFEG